MSIPDPSSCESLVFVSKPRVTVLMCVDGHIGVGIATCHPDDEWNEDFGYLLAWARAYEDSLLASTQPEVPWMDTGVFTCLKQAIAASAKVRLPPPLPHLVSKSGGQP